MLPIFLLVSHCSVSNYECSMNIPPFNTWKEHLCLKSPYLISVSFLYSGWKSFVKVANDLHLITPNSKFSVVVIWISIDYRAKFIKIGHSLLVWQQQKCATWCPAVRSEIGCQLSGVSSFHSFSSGMVSGQQLRMAKAQSQAVSYQHGMPLKGNLCSWAH